MSHEEIKKDPAAIAFFASGLGAVLTGGALAASFAVISVDYALRNKRVDDDAHAIVYLIGAMDRLQDGFGRVKNGFDRLENGFARIEKRGDHLTTEVNELKDSMIVISTILQSVDSKLDGVAANLRLLSRKRAPINKGAGNRADESF